jgi:hypothetical protein
VFIDLDWIEPGMDIADEIDSAVRGCAVFLAVIGRSWLTMTDERAHRRLDEPDDYVRFEIRTALELGARVIPVLVDGAVMPGRRELPDDLQKLARLSALDISIARFDYDEARLAAVIRNALATTAVGRAELAGSTAATCATLAASASPATIGGTTLGWGNGTGFTPGLR